MDLRTYRCTLRKSNLTDSNTSPEESDEEWHTRYNSRAVCTSARESKVGRWCKIVHRFCALFTFYCWRRDGKIPLFHCILSVTRGKVLSSVGFPEKTLPAERSIRCYRKFCSALSRFRGIGRSDDFSRVYYFSIGSFNPGARSTPIKDREPRGALETRSSFPGLKQNGFLPIIP